MALEAGVIREQQRQTWNKFSSGWGKWDGIVLPMLSAIGSEMVEELRPAANALCLDIASGTGEPGLSIAALVPQGRVIMTDLARGMLDIAAQNAVRRGLNNVEVRECSADQLPFDDATFDCVSCRFGLMFFPDVQAAVNEMTRVLKPGGKLCAAVWAGSEGNPWATVPMAAIATEVTLPPGPPDAPGLFRCATPGVISAIFSAAGLRDVAETDVMSALVTASGEQYWDYMTEVAAPVVAGLTGLDADARGRIRAMVLDKVTSYAVDGSIRVPIHARCIVGTR